MKWTCILKKYQCNTAWDYCVCRANDEETEKKENNFYLIWAIQLNQIKRRFISLLQQHQSVLRAICENVSKEWMCVCVCVRLTLSISLSRFLSLNDNIFISRKIVVSFYFSVWCARIVWIFVEWPIKKRTVNWFVPLWELYIHVDDNNKKRLMWRARTRLLF